MRRNIIIIVLLFMILSINSVKAEEQINITLNGSELKFDVNPVIKNQRTLAPIRKVFESMGLKVNWYPEERKVVGKDSNHRIELKINDNLAKVDGKVIKLDMPPIIYNQRTMVPVRFIAESTGAEVSWKSYNNTVVIKNESKTRINIGDSLSELVNKLGKPNRKDSSRYGFEWYIYNQDYKRYIQVGIADNKVVGLYSNSPCYSFINDINIDDNIDDINKNYNPVDFIKKGNTKYNFSFFEDEVDIISLKDSYVYIFYDKYNENVVTSILVVDKNTELSLDSFYGEKNKDLKISYQQQIFDLTNSIRAQKNLKPLKWSEKASLTAYNHSKDMALNNYFSHINIDGNTPFDRMESNNINYRRAGENIASGQMSSIFAHEAWMNSQGHRENILGNYENLGVGVYFGGSNNIYYTQNFFTGR